MSDIERALALTNKSPSSSFSIVLSSILIIKRRSIVRCSVRAMMQKHGFQKRPITCWPNLAYGPSARMVVLLCWYCCVVGSTSLGCTRSHAGDRVGVFCLQTALRGGGISSSESGSSSIPRSSNTRHMASQQSLMESPVSALSTPCNEADEGDLSVVLRDTENFIPPWNPSKKINSDGFLVDAYRTIPGEWEQDCSVGGRYADLRKKHRFFNLNAFGNSRDQNTVRTSQVHGMISDRLLGCRKHLRGCRKTQHSSSSLNSISNKFFEDGGSSNAAMSIHPGGGGARAAVMLRNPRLDDQDRQSLTLLCRVRQVPGDGNCLFHSVATCLSVTEHGFHVDMRNTTHLRSASSLLRQKAVECLRRRNRRLLFLQGRECLRAEELVEAAAAQYNITAGEYCNLMSQESYWGGGPEIVALCNVLRRPIHVYELCVGSPSVAASPNEKNTNVFTSRHAGVGAGGEISSSGYNSKKEFCLRRMACFGSPKYDRKEPLHILSADSRFPDVAPGRQVASGNHFLALFPYSSCD